METSALKREQARGGRLESALKRSKTQHLQLQDSSRQMQEQLRHLSRRLLLSQEEERKRISRELHDEIVQTLVAISMHLSALTVNAPVDIKELKAKIARTQRLVKKSVNIVHRFARELRPMVLDDLGLIPALQSFIKDFSRRTRLQVHFTAFTRVEDLSEIRKIVLYRVAQSALVNVHKHAKATEVKLSILKFPQVVRLEIHDNGQSFQPDRSFVTPKHQRLGLLGCRERVEMVGGKFIIKSSPAEGTTIIAEIPVSPGPSKSKRLKKSRPIADRRRISLSSSARSLRKDE